MTLFLRKDAKSVSIVAQGCFHPVTKVQSASLHFFLGSEEPDEEPDEEEVSFLIFLSIDRFSKSPTQEVDVKSLHHRREINKKTRSGDKKLAKQLKTAKKVSMAVYLILSV